MRSKLPSIPLLFACVIAFNILFPITAVGWATEVLYYLAYCLAIGGGAWLLSEERLPRFLALLFALAAFALGVINALLPFQMWTSLSWGVFLVAMQLVLVYALLRFIFSAHHVTRDVLIAGVTVYLVLGTVFIPIYTQLEALSPGSFAYNTALGDVQNASILWTRFLYFSYATLTTLGYGDITPLSGPAQALAVTEAIIGVLYIAILMARLVGVYASDFRRL
jgi:hypothetical protein